MNDPNGLILHKGLYHLYYQHNPEANEFGNISWGHATSTDLEQWKHHDVALWCKEGVMIYSGCTAIDLEGNICAIYTEHVGDGENYFERICLARSSDHGYSFDQENRIILLEHSDPDFRDPKVFRYEPDNCWMMCVALPKQHTILFFRSTDLMHWSPTGKFTSTEYRGQFWECPDLFPLLDENDNEVWILSLSGQNPDGKTWGMFYFLGDFDGNSFTSKSRPKHLDYGSDFYAGITFEGLKKRVLLAWCGNWAYAGKLNESGWSGMMSAPRSISIAEKEIRQEFISDQEVIALDVSSTTKKTTIQECEVKWSSNELVIDRSGSKRKFPDEYQQVEFHQHIENIDLRVDEGLLEFAMNGGLKTMTVRI